MPDYEGAFVRMASVILTLKADSDFRFATAPESPFTFSEAGERGQAEDQDNLVLAGLPLAAYVGCC